LVLTDCAHVHRNNAADNFPERNPFHNIICLWVRHQGTEFSPVLVYCRLSDMAATLNSISMKAADHLRDPYTLCEAAMNATHQRRGPFAPAACDCSPLPRLH